MNNILCDHEKAYCEDRKTKFFRTGFGELVVTRPHMTFRKHFDVGEGIYVFRNRGIEEDDEFEKIINNSLISPVVSDIEDDNWRGKFGIYWL